MHSHVYSSIACSVVSIDALSYANWVLRVEGNREERSLSVNVIRFSKVTAHI